MSLELGFDFFFNSLSFVLKLVLSAFFVSWGILINGQPLTNLNKVQVRSCQISIEGRSNLGPFRCDISQRLKSTDMIVESTFDGHQLSFDSLKFAFKTDAFKCALEPMTQDLRSTLKSAEYPFIYLSLKKLRIKPDNREIEFVKVKAETTVIIAGVEVDTDLENVLVTNYSDSLMTIQGKHIFQLSQFDLDPPSRLWGLVRVRNELEIDFLIELLTYPL